MNAAVAEDTRERLIQAAREVFAESGFHQATVRDICLRAGANVAAVNYHFSGKEALYAAALDFGPLTEMREHAARSSQCARLRLASFIHQFLGRLLAERDAPCTSLLARELVNPSPALDRIVSEAIAPTHHFIAGLVNDITGNRLDQDQVRRAVIGIVAQCVTYQHSRAVIERVYPGLCYSEPEIAAIAAHVADFSIAGLERLANPKGTLE